MAGYYKGCGIVTYGTAKGMFINACPGGKQPLKMVGAKAYLFDHLL
jgi:hypothetical protein